MAGSPRALAASSFAQAGAPRSSGTQAPASSAFAPGPGSGSQTQPQRPRRERGGERCAIAIEPAPGPLIAGEAATLLGELSCAQAASAANQTVELEQHVVGSRGFTAAGSTSTEGDGAFQFTTPEGLDANSVFYARALGARSRRTRVHVAPAVTLAGPAAGTQLLPSTRASAGAGALRTVVFTGSVSPVEAGAAVVLQRESASAGEDWRSIAFGEVEQDGRYTIAHSFSAAGPATIRAVVHPRGLRASASEALSYEIAPRQNRKLTIVRSAATLAYGQSVTIAGVAARAGEPLTLLARDSAGGYAAVASTRAGAGGQYAFAAQTPLQSTSYRVAGPRVSSVSVFEGVAPLLSLQPAASSIAAGEALRVCGTLTPARAGQLVYLQRRDSGGVGFHTVAATRLTSTAGYCLETTVFAASEQSYRVKVPRSDETQAVASGLFKVAVAPAPASALAALGPEGEAAGLLGESRGGASR